MEAEKKAGARCPTHHPHLSFSRASTKAPTVSDVHLFSFSFFLLINTLKFGWRAGFQQEKHRSRFLKKFFLQNSIECFYGTVQKTVSFLFPCWHTGLCDLSQGLSLSHYVAQDKATQKMWCDKPTNALCQQGNLKAVHTLKLSWLFSALLHTSYPLSPNGFPCKMVRVSFSLAIFKQQILLLALPVTNIFL